MSHIFSDLVLGLFITDKCTHYLRLPTCQTKRTLEKIKPTLTPLKFSSGISFTPDVMAILLCLACRLLRTEKLIPRQLQNYICTE